MESLNRRVQFTFIGPSEFASTKPSSSRPSSSSGNRTGGRPITPRTPMGRSQDPTRFRPRMVEPVIPDEVTGGELEKSALAG